MQRRALLKAAAPGITSLALPWFGRPVAARANAPTSTTGYREVARWSPVTRPGWAEVHTFSRILHDVYVRGEYAYCCYWDAGTWILDISDPTSPSFVARVGDYTREELVELSDDEEALRSSYLESPGNSHYVTVNDDASVMAVGAEGWDDPETPVRGVGGITLYDNSDITSPRPLVTIDPPRAADETRSGTWVTAHNFDILGDRLYSSWYQGGIKLHDISDPSDPQLLAWWRDPESASIWTAQAAIPGEFFVASSMGVEEESGGIYTFPDRAGEQADPPSLNGTTTTTTTTTSTGNARVHADGVAPLGTADYEPLGFVEIEGASEAVVGDDAGTVYVATGDGFAVVDVTDPTDPSVLTQRRDLLADREDGPLTSILDVKVDGNRLVVPGPAQRGALRGFLVYDVSDPATPEQRGPFYETISGNHNAFIQGNYVYLTGTNGRDNPLIVVDISDPTTPSTTTTRPTTTAATRTTVTTSPATSQPTTSAGQTTTDRPQTTDPTTTTTDSAPTAGFGIGAAIAGLGLGALGLRRFRRDDGE